MKNFLYVGIVIIGISSLFACTGPRKDRYERYQTFPGQKNLQAQVIRLDTALFRYPYRISIQGNTAIIMDLHNADYYYHAFAYPEWKYIVSFGKRGEAPDEMLSCQTFQFNSLDSIWALDANKMQITRWSVAPEDRSATREEVISLDKNLIRTLDFYATDQGFLVPDYLGQYRFSRIDRQGALLSSEGSIPTERVYDESEHMALAQGWRSFLDYNQPNQILAFVTQLGEVLEIFNTHTNTHRVLYGPGSEPVFEKAPDGSGIPTGIKGFCDVQVTDRYIYTVFDGSTFKDIINAYKQGQEPEDGGRHLYVFTHDGTPVCDYTLDHAINGIFVDEQAHTITALDVNSDDPIVVYEI